MSVKKRLGFLHVRGGRFLRVADPHQVPTNTHNDFAETLLRPSGDPNFMPIVKRTFDGAWVTADVGSIALEVVAQKTEQVIAIAYYSGAALNLLRYMDAALPARWFAPAVAWNLDLQATFDAPYSERVDYRHFIAAMMRLKFSSAPVFGITDDVVLGSFCLETTDLDTANEITHGLANAYTHKLDGDAVATSHVLGTIQARKEGHHLTMHLQPPRDRSDHASQPFFHELVQSSPHLVAFPFFDDLEPFVGQVREDHDQPGE